MHQPIRLGSSRDKTHPRPGGGPASSSSHSGGPGFSPPPPVSSGSPALGAAVRSPLHPLPYIFLSVEGQKMGAAVKGRHIERQADRQTDREIGP